LSFSEGFFYPWEVGRRTVDHPLISCVSLDISICEISNGFNSQTLYCTNRRKECCWLLKLLTWIQWEWLLEVTVEPVFPVTDLIPDLGFIIKENRAVFIPENWIVNHTVVSVGELDHGYCPISGDYRLVILSDEVLGAFY
jgi:hypothetical protein